MTITERLGHALAQLRERWGGKRHPKAFYLVAADWAEFMATDPPWGQFPFGNNPPIMVDDPTFERVPVRESTGKVSKLYDHTGLAHRLI